MYNGGVESGFYGMVQKDGIEPVPDDRRYNVIELTAHGLEMYQKVSGIYKRKIGEIMNALEPDELEALKSILEKLRKNLDRIGVD